MKVTFLGTGTSIGVPAIGCTCEVCRSNDPKDKRLRSSALLETDKGLRILIDCGPDFRQQIMNRFGKLDAVLLTHVHYDHVGGIDDLRPFAWFGDVDIYAQQDVIDTLHTTMPYCFKEHLYPGVPLLKLHEVVAGRPFTISRPEEYVAQFPGSGATLEGVMKREGHTEVIPAVDENLDVMPVAVMHGKLPILGYRFGSFAYITDMKSASKETMRLLEGIKVLVINALRFEKEHHSHQLVDDAIQFARAIGTEQTYFIHLTHDIGTHDIANSKLPRGFHFAYDGQEIEFL